MAVASKDSDSDSEILVAALFQEPPSYRAPSPKPTKTEYTLRSGTPTLHLNLVGSSPLWGHILWHTSTTLAGYLEAHSSLVSEKSVLELGAGAGLPSLVSALLGARRVCVTDYPEPELISNLKNNVTDCAKLWSGAAEVVAEGYLWGALPGPLMQKMMDGQSGAFDLLILSDLLFNHSEHRKLVASVKTLLRRSSSKSEDYPRALVFFTPHRPWLYEKDLAFFDLARQEGLVVEKIFTEVLDKPMFANDRGDEMMRRTVEGWELRWP